MKYLLYVFLGAFLIPTPYAQGRNMTLEGTVVDRFTSLPVGGAAISVAGNLAMQDAVSDSDGDFVLTFRPSVTEEQRIRLLVRKEGYEPYDKLASFSYAALTVLVTPRVRVPSVRSQQPKQEEPNVYVNYLRLFGAQQAPLILGNLYPSADSSSQESDRTNVFDNSSWTGTIRHFWDSWEYKNAMPLRTRVWQELFEGDHEEQPHYLLRIACENDPVALQYTRFTRGGQNCGQTGAGPEYEVCEGSPNSVREVKAALEKRSLEMGFLAIIIENTSGKTLRDVELHYREIVKSPPLSLPYEDASLVERDLATAPERKLTLPRFKVGGSVLWLLAIYHKNEQGFPESYLSSVTRPTRLTFTLGGRQVSETIRKPLLDRAVKVPIPYGWYYQ